MLVALAGASAYGTGTPGLGSGEAYSNPQPPRSAQLWQPGGMSGMLLLPLPLAPTANSDVALRVVSDSPHLGHSGLSLV